MFFCNLDGLAKKANEQQNAYAYENVLDCIAHCLGFSHCSVIGLDYHKVIRLAFLDNKFITYLPLYFSNKSTMQCAYFDVRYADVLEKQHDSNCIAIDVKKYLSMLVDMLVDVSSKTWKKDVVVELIKDEATVLRKAGQPIDDEIAIALDLNCIGK